MALYYRVTAPFFTFVSTPASQLVTTTTGSFCAPARTIRNRSPSGDTVVHRVLGGTYPEYIGTEQLRYFRIHGDTLSIGETKPLPCRVLVRVRNGRAPR